jgi:ubiquitin-conjugating enzyme E2 M
LWQTASVLKEKLEFPFKKPFAFVRPVRVAGECDSSPADRSTAFEASRASSNRSARSPGAHPDAHGARASVAANDRVRRRREMIKLFSAKDKQEKEAAAKAASGDTGPKQSPGEIRLAKDISELTLAKTMAIAFPDGADKMLHFVITIKPDEGYYRGGKFVFDFNVPAVYPHEPPKVKCTQKIYHPNVDTEGNVCLNILREDWSPVLSISSCVYGLQFLFMDPNPDDPLNKEAARDLTETPRQFELNVRRAMQGGRVGGESYSDVTR